MTNIMDQSGIDVKLEFIIRELDEIKAKLEKNYVSQEEFRPVKNIVYSAVGIVLTVVFTSLIYVIIKK